MTTAATATTTTETRRDRLRSRLTRLRGRRPSLRWEPTSIRTPILVWSIGFLALATVSSVLVTYRVLLIQLDRRIDAELTQEAGELAALASGKDPDTGKDFGPNVRRIFKVYLDGNVPSRNEALITFIGGEPFLRSRPVVPYRLDRDRELVARWSSVREPDRGRVDTPAGPVEYLALPLRAEGKTRGVFVAAIFVEGAQGEAESAVRAAGAVGLGLLLLGSLLAWRVTNRVVRPVTALERTARSISERDLGARIPVEGRDQVAQLAATFNDMLDRLERAFGSQRRFIDDASHELKTPLTIVRGHLELLDSDPEEREAALAIVMDELDRMGRIVQDLLLLANHGRPDFLSLERVEVGALTEELFAKAKSLAPVNWTLEARGTGAVMADRQRLTQAVVQLAQNAVRHGNEGGAIALGSGIANGEARIWVRDHGPGIALHEQQAIFERFRRGHLQRTEGAGLGLAIVKAIAESHQGRVEVDSRPGAGATFTVVIPVSGGAEKAARSR